MSDMNELKNLRGNTFTNCIGKRTLCHSLTPIIPLSMAVNSFNIAHVAILPGRCRRQ